MKTVLIEPATEGRGSSLRLIADSAITPPGRPVFLPDTMPDWTVGIYLAVKVSRLGKNIAPKFAHRYFDMFTLVALLQPAHDLPDAPAGFGLLMDNALTAGPWMPVDDFPAPITIDASDSQTTIDNLKDILSQAVVEISRYATLKTGDLILPLRLNAPLPVTIGSEIKASINGTPVINMKIK